MQKLLFLSLIVFITINIFSQQPLELKLQQRGEVVVSIDVDDLAKLPNQGSWSIDRVMNDRVIIYLNKDYYHKLVELNIPFIPEPTPSLINKVQMAHSISEMQNWDAYPDYDTYLAMMYQFATGYPEICKLDTIGFTAQNRLLLAVKISDNVHEDEEEPEILYTSSMHGDELTGYVLMLRLADNLLRNYGVAKGGSLVDELEIYINPLANPDGAFAAGNKTVIGAIRENANYIDLNRNFPDPVSGDHPDGYDWQPETLAMMEYMKGRYFSLSMNFHGGAELLNYPWDTESARHPDDDWFNFISRSYVDKVHEFDVNYMTDEGNGVTNGFDWYVAKGTRQDYVTHFLHGREITAELNGFPKLREASELPNFWDKNFLSLLDYMEQALYGIHGKVTDLNGEVLGAKVEVLRHDDDSSHVRTQRGGAFYRYLKSGTYDIKVSATGHKSKTISNVVINDFEKNELDVQLEIGVSITDRQMFEAKVYPNPNNGEFKIVLPQSKNSMGNMHITLFSLDGKGVMEQEVSGIADNFEINLPDLEKGIFILTLKNGTGIATQKIIIQ